MQEISSAQNPGLKAAIRLHRSRGRKQQNRIIIFGMREIRRAIAASRIDIVELFLAKTPAGTSNWVEVQQLVSDTGAELFLLDEKLYSKLEYGSRDSGVIAVALRPGIGNGVQSLNAIEPVVRSSKSAMIVVLVGLENPGNLGAIVRSADGAGADAVIVADPMTDPFHPNSIRNSVGTVFSMPLAIADSTATISWLETQQINPCAAVVQTENSLYQTDLSGPTAIVVGNESDGLPPIWRTPGLTAVSLPMLGCADSLNVSVTASIMIYETRRQKTT